MNFKSFFWPWFFAGLAAVSTAQAQEKFLVQVPAVFDAQANVGENIRNECGLENMVGNHVYGKVSENFPGTLPIKDPGKAGPAKVLTLTILSATGAGGGAWSGAKAITLRADLMQNGQLLQTLIKRRQSRGGFAGTCGILERDAQTLAKDVVAWLRQPASVMSDVANLSEADAPVAEKSTKEAEKAMPVGEASKK
jgi:hypothetical protein